MLEYLLTTIFVLLFSRTGFPRTDISMAIGSIILGVSFACFLFLSGYALINIVPLLIAIQIPLFWIPFNVAMIGLTTIENRGLVISMTFLVSPLVYFVGPIAGGATIKSLGYDVLFFVALLFLVINSSIIFLTWKKHGERYAPKVHFSEMRSSTSPGFFLEGVQEGVFVIAVPLATFFFVGEEFNLGKILAVFGVAGGLMSVVAGKLSDRKGNRMLFINLAVLICGPLLLLAAFIPDLFLFGLTIGTVYFFLPLFA
ncbi:MAG: MFS transporter, partial [Thermoplasmata archaeon]